MVDPARAKPNHDVCWLQAAVLKALELSAVIDDKNLAI